MLEIINLRKTFNPGTVNEKTALDGVSLTLRDGDFVSVIGGNGAGKSTLLNAVAGTWLVDSGTISIDGVNVTRLPEHKRAQFIGRVFQDPMMGTAATMQIEENLALALRRGKRRTLRAGITAAERDRYRELLKILGLGLEDRLTTKVGLLSGGQRQALTLLMATLQKAKAPASGRTHRGPGPQDRCQGSGNHGAHHPTRPPDHTDDHPQHARRHRPRKSAHHDVRRAHCGGRKRRGKAAPDGGGPAGTV